MSLKSKASSDFSDSGVEPGGIEHWELFWCRHQPWLQTKGYMLRPRYRPGWIPSWAGTDIGLKAMFLENGATSAVRLGFLSFLRC